MGNSESPFKWLYDKDDEVYWYSHMSECAEQLGIKSDVVDILNLNLYPLFLKGILYLFILKLVSFYVKSFQNQAT